MPVNGSCNGGVPNLSHHLSQEGRERLPNPMKHIWTRIAKKPNMITLANGEPHSTLFPISRIDVQVPAVTDTHIVDQVLSGTAPQQTLTSLKGGDCALDLSVALQYSSGLGCAATIERVKELNEVLHCPHHNDVVLTLGNADGVTKCFRLLGDRGDTFLIEEYSFPGLVNAPLAQGIRWAPLKMDAQGIIPSEMEQVLRTWNEETQGRRPRVLYTIPVGQNPTGSTLSIERRRRIYEIAREFDIIILEDDPYYFLQYGATDSKDEFKAMSPTFLSMDVEGRVIRIDTFSKTLVPGIRLGWITCNAMFAQKLLLLTDSTTQHTNGFSQALVCELLTPGRGWGIPGFLTWTQSLCTEYKRRRDFFMALLEKYVVSTGYAKSTLPEAGMFFWIEVLLDKHPRRRGAQPFENGDGKECDKVVDARLMDSLADFVFERGLAIMPAVSFAIMPEHQVHAGRSATQNMHPSGLNFFRATFAGQDETMEAGLKILGCALVDFFES
ncbi:PLP-dependent transferase [Exidia glandulosa HHB12029]|uniref:PLP-dependent transferase n=1 Tax=Exidia glandulosa HHB12029 TaxID=1314781 RepID=A0A165EP07_EXIGL|nr:PLP-dependent transferase [Exidia glandulosa HHB12029]